MAATNRVPDIAEFTGISSPYEAPENLELTVNTGAAEPVTVGWALRVLLGSSAPYNHGAPLAGDAHHVGHSPTYCYHCISSAK